MNNVIAFSAPQNSRKGIKPEVDILAAQAVATSVCLRPGPEETGQQFVTRLVRAYKAEGGK